MATSDTNGLLMGSIYSMGASRQLVGQFPTQKSSKSVDAITSLLTEKIVPKLPTQNHRRTLTHSNNEYHYKVSGEHVFICIAKSEAQKRVCWAFIDDMENYVLQNGTRDLRSFIRDKLEYYNNPNNDKINSLKRKIDDVKDVMIDNIDKLLERGEELDSLLQKTNDLADDSYIYRGRSRKLKNQMLMRYLIIAAALILIIIAILIIVVFIACGFPTFYRCRRSGK